MSAVVITSNGLSRKTFQEIRSELKTTWLSTFGSAVDLSESSLDGHQIDLEASEVSSLSELIQAVYTNLTFEGCSGIWVDIFMSYRGLTRIASAYSTVTATFSGSSGTVVDAGTLIKSSGGSTNFSTNESVTIGSGGTASVIATAVETGPIDISAGTWEMVSASPSVTVSVLTDGTIGRNEETDAEFKVRGKSFVRDGLATIPTIASYIQNNVDGVIGCSVSENETASTDSEGRPPHSIEVYVLGGSDADVAAAVFHSKPAGIKAYGHHVADPGYPVNDSSGNTHYVNWTVPANAYLWLKISITEYNEETLPTNYSDVIKAAVVSWAVTEYSYGKDVIPQRVSVPVYTCAGVEFVTVTAAVVYSSSTIPTVYTSSRIAVSPSYEVTTSTNRIEVTLS